MDAPTPVVVAVLSVLGTIVVAILTAVVSPVLVSRLQDRAKNNPAAGWQAAVDTLNRRVEQLQTREQQLTRELDEVRKHVEEVEARWEAERSENRRLTVIIAEQSTLLNAYGNRVAQLEGAWPAGVNMPAEDPAYRAAIRRRPDPSARPASWPQ